MTLSRAQVVDAAVVILDEYGLGDLTMRRLATSLGVQPGALYWHVPSKQALLAEVADAIVTGLPTLGSDAPADDALPDGAGASGHPGAAARTGGPGALAAVAAWARALRAALLAHRDGAEVVASAYALRSDEDPMVAALTEHVQAADVPRGEAVAGAAALVHYVLGHTAHEQAHAQLTAAGATGTGARDDGTRFETGLALLLDGLALRAGARG